MGFRVLMSELCEEEHRLAEASNALSLLRHHAQSQESALQTQHMLHQQQLAESAEDALLTAAATKVQAHYRSKRARAEMDAMRQRQAAAAAAERARQQELEVLRAEESRAAGAALQKGGAEAEALIKRLQTQIMGAQMHTDLILDELLRADRQLAALGKRYATKDQLTRSLRETLDARLAELDDVKRERDKLRGKFATLF